MGGNSGTRQAASSLDDKSKSRLSGALRRGDVTLYLGAGVSVGNGLPTWEKLVLAMYYAALSKKKMPGYCPFSNYLFAIAEWHLKQSHEPLEITARKVRKYYRTQATFLGHLRETLY